MMIAIPLADGKLCSHFGHCEKFAFLSVDPSAKKVLGRQDETPPPHEPGLLPRWLAEKGAGLIIAGGMGGHAQQLFAQQKIQVVTGAPVETPEALAQSWMAGSLHSGPNTCDH